MGVLQRADELPYQRRSYMRIDNGIIGFIMGDLPGAQKLLALLVTNTFPIIPLGKNPILLHTDGTFELLTGFEHTSIPPDLRLHMSSNDEHLFFDISELRPSIEQETPLGVCHLFTHIALPFGRTEPLVPPGERRRWFQAALISPARDEQFAFATRLFVDFFIHSLNADTRAVVEREFTHPGMRLAADNSGPILGPFEFGAIQRRAMPVRRDLAFTIRWATSSS
jgi:hypothetical protein